MSERARIGIVFDNFGPYHVARMAGAAKHGDVVAIEASPNRSEYAWVKPCLPASLGYLGLAGSADSHSERARLRRSADLALDGLHAIALPGWSSYASLVLLKAARARKMPAILMSETNGWDFARKPVVESLKRAVVAHFAAGLVTSDAQADYLVALGLQRDAIFRGYNAVDNLYFAKEAERRALLPMPESDGTALPEAARGRYFLASSRFIPKKNLPGLLRSYATFRQGRPSSPADWPLVLLGDGEQRDSLEALRAALGMTGHVHMPGFKQIHDLPSFYAMAGAFVHASTTEQWGLVVNEAMASGLPVAVSNRCGCAQVLVEDDVNGYIFDPNDEAAITRALAALAGLSTGEKQAMRQRSLDRIANWGPDRFGSGLADAVAHARRRRLPEPGVIDRAGLTIATLERALAGHRAATRMPRRAPPVANG